MMYTTSREDMVMVVYLCPVFVISYSTASFEDGIYQYIEAMSLPLPASLSRRTTHSGRSR